MGRINTNVQSMLAQRVLTQNNGLLSTSLERLSTGLRVNRGKDDPAGLIAGENMRVEQKALNTAIANAERADQVANIAEGGLQEVQSLLTELQAMVTSAANTAGQSAEERQAAQLSVDSILQTIDRIASSTNFQGIKLLNGNFDFKLSGVAAGVASARVNAAKFSGASLDVDVIVTASAQKAGVFLSAGGTNLDISTGSAFVVEVAGTAGAREFSFASGTSLEKVAAAINTFTDVTGVEAAVSGTGLRLTSSKEGAREFVSVRVIDDGGINLSANGDAGTTRGIYRFESANANAATTTGATTFASASNAVRDSGQNIAGTINGMVASSNGRTLKVSSDFLDAEIVLTASQSSQLGAVGGGSAFSITGGGAKFLLDGKASIAAETVLGIGEVATRKLGNADAGFLDALGSGKSLNLVNGDANEAQRVVTAAIEQVANTRGRLGTFQKLTVGATIRSLGVAMENTAAAASIIRDADFASETASLTRAQILVSASTNTLALANSAPQTALQLLG